MKSSFVISVLLLTFVAFSLPSLANAGGYPECEGVEDFVLYDENSCTSYCDCCNGGWCCSEGAQFSQFNRAYGDPEAAYEGNEGIRVTPTYWHQHFFRIYPGRTDFRCYESMEFMIKATVDDKPLFQRIMLSDSTQGSWVNLEDYVEGGVIDNTKWHKVSIPLEDLKSETFALNSVFLINFARMMGSDPNRGCYEISGYIDNPTAIPASCDTPQHFFIDNMILKPATISIDILGYEFTSDRSLTIRTNNGIDLQEAKAAVAASSSTAFAVYPKFGILEDAILPQKVGFSRSAVRATYQGGQGFAESEWVIHLLYPQDTFAQAAEYILSGISTVGTDQDTLEILRDSDAVNPSIQVNQLGFIPDKPKHAYVAQWLGDAGSMPVNATTFHVVDSANASSIRYTGNLVLRLANDAQAGSNVYDADFGDFQEPGNYRVHVPGVGLSYSFDINDSVWDIAAYRTSRLLYYKRNIRLEEPYVDSGPGWSLAREGINPALDGQFHPILETYPLHNGETAFEFKQIQPGWYDAGDYGHYMHNLYHIWPAFSLAFDLGNPQDNVLNIPESGNGIPDLLDELEFGMTFAMSMQASDGGVYWRLCSRDFDQVMPKDVTLPRIIYEKTTRATAQFAGMAAIHARLIRPYNEARADEVLAAGVRAWDYLQTHEAYPPEGTPYRNPTELSGGGEYSASDSFYNQLWAASELFRTTGNTTYQDAYKVLLGPTHIDPSGAPYTTYMWWAMVMTDHPNVDVVLRELARRGIMRAADTKIERSMIHPYRVPKHPLIEWSGWHGQSGSIIYASALLQAYAITGNKTYSDEAHTCVDMSLGANPLSQSFITGVGHKPVVDPLDRISLDDGVDTPVPGMPSPGFTWHLPGFREPYISVNNAFYPPEALTDKNYHDSYPVLRRYLDSSAVIPHNEGTISEAALYAAPLTIMSGGATVVDGTYDWKWLGRTDVLDQTFLPLDEVQFIDTTYITQWGGRVGQASSEYLNAFTPDQVCAIDAPTIPYWVGKMNDDVKEGLCEEQIANFQTWSLFTALPSSKVPFIPCEMIPTLPWYKIRDAGEEYKAALSPDQINCMTSEQCTRLEFLWDGTECSPLA